MIQSFITYNGDARQNAGLFTLFAIVALIALAVGATAISGWSGTYASTVQSTTGVVIFTLWQAVLSVVFSLAFALPVALALHYVSNFFGRKFILILFTIPLSLPVIVAVLAILTLLGRNGFAAQLFQLAGFDWRPDVYGLQGILIAHVFFNMPLAVRIMLQSLESIPQTQWKLAESLRFNGVARFTMLQWPVLKAGLPSLASLIFLLCLGSYAIILVLGGGPQATTIQVAIYQALSFDLDLARASVLTGIQLGLSLLLVVALPSTSLVRVTTAFKAQRSAYKTSLMGYVLSAFVIVIATLYVALPLGAMVVAGLTGGHLKMLSDALFWQAVFTSLVIALGSALLAVTAAWCISAGQFSCEKNQNHVLSRLLRSTPLAIVAVPSLVLGVGWFLFALQTGLPFSIAPLLIMCANALFALPFALQIIQPKLMETYQSHDRLAFVLRVRGLTRLRILDLPVMRQALASAALFSFALSLGDLGVVTLFGSDQILTLPALIFQKMGSYRSNDAASLALYLTLLTVLVTYIAMRVVMKQKLDVELRNVRFSYPEMAMQFDLGLQAGSITIVTGPSGAGKSTLLNLIAGFERPVSGQITLCGKSMTGIAPSSRPIAMLFQDHNDFSHLTVEDNVGLGIAPNLKLNDQQKLRVQDALARVGLNGKSKRLPDALSGGERQRIAFARVLVQNHPILLLDEPFTALGPALGQEMIELLADLQREKQLTVLSVTHHPDKWRHVANGFVFVENGRIIAQGRMEELRVIHENAAIQSYLGVSG